MKMFRRNDNISLNSSLNKKFFKQKLQKIKIHILCSITLFRKLCRLLANIEKYGACWISKETRAQAYASVRYTHPHTHTHMCKAYCFPTVTMVSRTRLNVFLIRTLPLFFICCMSVSWITKIS